MIDSSHGRPTVLDKFETAKKKKNVEPILEDYKPTHRKHSSPLWNDDRLFIQMTKRHLVTWNSEEKCDAPTLKDDKHTHRYI